MMNIGLIDIGMWCFTGIVIVIGVLNLYLDGFGNKTEV